MSYTLIPITVNAASRTQVDALSPKLAIGSSKKPQLIAGETFILAFHFVNDDGSDYPLGAGDSFEFGADTDFVRWLATGQLSGAIAANDELTSIAAKAGLSTASIPSTGFIFLANSAGETERIAYTAFSSATRTFSVSHTALYSYADGAALSVEDELMLYAGNGAVDIPGDWSEIDRAAGKISVRVSAIADAFSAKLDSSTGEAKLKMELRRYPAGSSSPSCMYRDGALAYASVIGLRTQPGATSIQFLTETSGDARYVKQAAAPDIAFASGAGPVIMIGARSFRLEAVLLNDIPTMQLTEIL